MIKHPTEMTREELVEYSLDLRKTITDLHIRFLRGLVIELEAGEIHPSMFDPELIQRLKTVLRI